MELAVGSRPQLLSRTRPHELAACENELDAVPTPSGSPSGLVPSSPESDAESCSSSWSPPDPARSAWLASRPQGTPVARSRALLQFAQSGQSEEPESVASATRSTTKQPAAPFRDTLQHWRIRDELLRLRKEHIESPSQSTTPASRSRTPRTSPLSGPPPPPLAPAISLRRFASSSPSVAALRANGDSLQLSVLASQLRAARAAEAQALQAQAASEQRLALTAAQHSSELAEAVATAAQLGKALRLLQAREACGRRERDALRRRVVAMRAVYVRSLAAGAQEEGRTGADAEHPARHSGDMRAWLAGLAQLLNQRVQMASCVEVVVGAATLRLGMRLQLRGIGHSLNVRE